MLLIGIDDDNPVTVLEGNHRLTAALLASPDVLQEPLPGFLRIVAAHVGVVLVSDQPAEPVALRAEIGRATCSMTAMRMSSGC